MSKYPRMEGVYQKMLSLVGKFGDKKYTDALELHVSSPNQTKEFYKKNKEVKDFLQQIDQMQETFELVNFYHYPFGVPQDYPNATEIKDILRISFYMQHVLEAENACGKVCLLLHKCFESIGVSHRVAYGVFECAGLKNAHVWLYVGDHLVDNTYVSLTSMEDFVTVKMAMKYMEIDPDTVKDLFLGDEDTRKVGITDHTTKAFKWELQNSDKSLAIMKNKNQLKHYFDVMKEFMAKRYRAQIDISSIVCETCWNCNEKSNKLLKCGKCKVALYCCKECQKSDWKNIHKLVCLPPNTF
ncbi:uncharacterized protein [Mytilus edulis]|uniref:uncharacterized protein n=1 Tax=Mytilus edulis TaxID=6550 RepID=UPI0039F073E9